MLAAAGIAIMSTITLATGTQVAVSVLLIAIGVVIARLSGTENSEGGPAA
jgi:hypothetical protein